MTICRGNPLWLPKVETRHALSLQLIIIVQLGVQAYLAHANNGSKNVCAKLLNCSSDSCKIKKDWIKNSL